MRFSKSHVNLVFFDLSISSRSCRLGGLSGLRHDGDCNRTMSSARRELVDGVS